MDLGINKEQKLLKKSVHEFLGKEFPKAVVRELEESEGFSPKLWKKMADLGWLGLTFPDVYDGSEMSFFDLVILLEEMGSNLCPSPFVPTVILSGFPILTAGSEEQKRQILPKISNGELICTLALNEPDALYDISNVKAEARLNERDYILNGTKIFVPYAHVANLLLIVAKLNDPSTKDDGLTIFMVDAMAPGIKIVPLNTLARDKQFEIILRDVQVPKGNILGPIGGGQQVLMDTLEKATVARCAEMIGGAQAAMDLALEHARIRVQFGKPIGAFQAIQHHFANMWIDINASKILVYKAASNISKGKPDAKEVAMAKARTGETFRRVTLLSHQIFGAMGFAMENDLHLYHRRAISGDQAFGNYDFQR